MEGSYGMFNPTTDAKKEEGGPQKPQRRMPGRGVLDGIRQDLKAAKESGDSYDPRGTGAAWTHNFLNKKPWHPLTFRNMARVYEKEQEHYEAEKRKAESRAEFEAEQAYLKTLSLLSPEEQEKYRQRQSVSFLYMKPPGYDAALERAEKAQQAGQAVGPGGEALAGGAAGGCGAAAQQQQGVGQQQQQQRGGRAPPPGGHMKAVLGGIKAVAQQAQQRYELKHVSGTGMGRSPPRSAPGAAGDELQQFVVGDMDSEEEEEALRLAAIPPEERRRMQRAQAKAKRKAEKASAAAQLDQAKAFLRAAGLALPSDDEGGSGSGSSSEDSSSSSSDSDSGGEGGSARKRRRRRTGSRERKERRSKERRSGKERKDKKRRKEKKKKKRRRGKDD